MLSCLYDKHSECPEESGLDNDVSRAGLLNLGTSGIWGQIILCCGGLSCALQNVSQYLWPLPTKCQ